MELVPDQAYFFTKEWQEKEAEADRDIGEDKLEGPFDDAAQALTALKRIPQWSDHQAIPLHLPDGERSLHPQKTRQP